MSYLAHSKRARIDSYDNNVNNSSVIEHKDKLLQHIQSLYLHNDYSDVSFVFGPDVIPGHKQILSVNHKWRNILCEKSSIDMEDTGLEPFKELLRYLYTGRLNLDDYEPGMIQEIRQLAENFEMWDLVSPLLEQESIQINLDNVLKLLTESTIDSSTGKMCLNFIANNTQDVLYQDEFYDLPDSYIYAIFSRDDLLAAEQVIFEAVRRYVSGNSSGDNDTKLIISTVRIALLPFEYIWINVRKFLEEKSLLSIQDLSTISSAKAKISLKNPEIRSRAFCLPGEDVIAIKAKNPLSTHIIRGKIGDFGEEANSIELDLGLQYFLNGIGIVLSNMTKFRYAFKVETSVDGKKWQLLYDFTKYHTSNKVDLSFDGRVIRYISISEGICYPDLSDKKKETKPVRKIMNIIGLYEEPTGIVKLRDNLLSSKYLFSQMACDFTYKSWFKKNGKNFYVCALNDPIVAVLQQPVWMDSISLYIPEEEEREYNFIVEVTASPEYMSKGKDKWLLVGNYRDESRRGEVEVCFEPTVVNAFRVTGTKVVNGKGKEKDFSVEIRI